LLDKIAGVGIQDVNSTSTDNVWIGVTAENQEQANKRIPILLQIPAAKHFVSIEPMLGPVDLNEIRPSICETITQDVLRGIATNETKSLRDGLPVLDWVICGGESGPKARPMHPDWVRFLRDQCRLSDVPFFFKQWGEWLPGELKQGKTYYLRCDNNEVYSSSNRERQNFGTHPDKYSGNLTTIRVGRKAAGNLIDGEQHHNWPNNL
jgi:protein gp37